jgi:hypothetical protein
MAIGVIKSAGDRHVVSRHHHLYALGQIQYPRHIRCPEIKLRTIPVEKRRMTPALFLAQYTLGLELRVRGDRSRAPLPPDRAPPRHAWCRAATRRCCRPPDPRQAACGTSPHPCTPSWWSRGYPRSPRVAHMDDTALHTAGHHRATTGYAEHILDRHQKRLVHIALGLGNVTVDGRQKLENRLGVRTVRHHRFPAPSARCRG